ncbi:MAG: hypothetical protein NW217_13840 [Hyphomicrobiaceae bacterium]|nr:hypothetical protein [Hyphomicrobiaceae bacterium]
MTRKAKPRMRIPPRPAYTLSGREVFVPRDFTGMRNALLVAFDRSHLVAFPSWRAALREALLARTGTGFYAALLLGEPFPLRRRLLEWAMRLEIQDPFEREHIALLYCNVADWLTAAGRPPTDEPLLVVTLTDGSVLATSPGFPDPRKTALISDALIR